MPMIAPIYARHPVTRRNYSQSHVEMPHVDNLHESDRDTHLVTRRGSNHNMPELVIVPQPLLQT